MTDVQERDAKLIQYLVEAYGKEKELEQALEAHIAMTAADSQKTYRKRLQEHLRETKRHGKDVERRIKKLGGTPGLREDPVGALASVVAPAAAEARGRIASTAKGPLHMARGTGEEEKLLKNAKTEYFNEHEEIATYAAIETLAEAVGDGDTAKLARSIRRDEERMARYLEGLIPRLAKAVARAEIPAAQRRTRGGARRRTSGGGRSTSRRSASGRSRGARSAAGSSGGRSSSRSASSRSSGSRSSTSRSSGSRSSGGGGARRRRR